MDKLLDRDLSIAVAKGLIDIASPLLQKLVNYATNVFGRCCTSTSKKPDEDASVLMLYYHIMEMTDATEILISKSCPEPAHLLLRSSFEALLSIEYILEDESTYVQRSLSWLVNYTHKWLEFYESLRPDVPEGKSLAKAFKKHKNKAFHAISFPDTKKAIENLEPFLSEPHAKPIEEEYQRCKRKNRNQACRWYHLFEGPKNLRVLSSQLKREAEYQFFYKQWSSITHAQDFSRFIAKSDSNTREIGPLRETRNISNVSYFAAYFMWEATCSIMKKFRPDENIQPFHKSFSAEMKKLGRPHRKK